MRINPHRDTFFNLINCKTHPKTGKSKIREQDKTPKQKSTLKTASKTLAHQPYRPKQESGLYTAVYKKPTAHNHQNSKPLSKQPQITKPRVYKIARILLRFKIVYER